MLSLGQTLANAAGLRSRKKFHFEVVFKLQDLLNCTYVSGVLFAKIRLKEGGHFSHSSQRVEVISHAVSWEEEVHFPCKLYASANTAELEPCVCKVSVRKETHGGRSYKKLGYVPINMAEFAGAGVVQRKYLLESYNEHKHKPDNSILRVKVMLRQTSGDVLFKAPRPPVWELSEPEQDEGIQADLQSSRRVSHSNVRASTASTLSGVSTGSGSGNLCVGASLQDMRYHAPQPPTSETKSSSACSLHGHSSDSGSSEYESASQHSSSSGQEKNPPNTLLESQTTHGEAGDVSSGQVKDASYGKGFLDTLDLNDNSHPEQSNSVAGSELQLLRRPPADGYSLSYPRSHRREPNDSGGRGSPSRTQHRRIHSITISGYSCRSTPAYSTQSERSERAVAATEEIESLLSSRTRMTTQSQVEQSRVDTSSVIDELWQNSDLSRSAEEESPGLQIYVDRSKGDLVVAGPDLDRRFSNLKPLPGTRHHHKSVSPVNIDEKWKPAGNDNLKEDSRPTGTSNVAHQQSSDSAE